MDKVLYIFSKNRACQLDALLCSLVQYGYHKDYDIEVLYTYEERYKDSYNTLINSWPEIKFTFETNFRTQFIDTVQKYEYICTSTDDQFWFSESDIKAVETALQESFCFSYRYGMNTVLQDPFNNIYQTRLYAEQKDGYIKWNFLDYPPLYNYGFPLAIDAHVYKTSRLLPLIEQIDFNNPTQLESNLFQFREYIFPYITSFNESVSVNVPLNNMSGATEHMGIEEELFIGYTQGKRLQYLKDKIIASHQQLNWTLISC